IELLALDEMPELLAARSLWLRARNPASYILLLTTLQDNRPRIRALAQRLARAERKSWIPNRLPTVLARAHDASPEVRAELAITLRGATTVGKSSSDPAVPRRNEGIARGLIDVASRWDGEDRRYLEAL